MSPPIALIPQVLAGVRGHGLQLVLVGPHRSGLQPQIWVAGLIQLLTVPGWALPHRADLLSQASGDVLHPSRTGGTWSRGY